MTPRAYMIFGAVSGVFIAIIELLPMHINVAVVAFAAGALFGKGYGIWEERDRRRVQDTK